VFLQLVRAVDVSNKMKRGIILKIVFLSYLSTTITLHYCQCALNLRAFVNQNVYDKCNVLIGFMLLLG